MQSLHVSFGNSRQGGFLSFFFFSFFLNFSLEAVGTLTLCASAALSAMASPSTCQLSLTELPCEIQLLIFEHLRTQDLGNVVQVCTLWRTLGRKILNAKNDEVFITLSARYIRVLCVNAYSPPLRMLCALVAVGQALSPMNSHREEKQDNVEATERILASEIELPSPIYRRFDVVLRKSLSNGRTVALHFDVWVNTWMCDLSPLSDRQHNLPRRLPRMDLCCYWTHKLDCQVGSLCDVWLFIGAVPQFFVDSIDCPVVFVTYEQVTDHGEGLLSSRHRDPVVERDGAKIRHLQKLFKREFSQSMDLIHIPGHDLSDVSCITQFFEELLKKHLNPPCMIRSGRSTKCTLC